VLGEEFGPLSFRQLARLVREGSVAAEDAVRPDFQDRWQSAQSVIGLYRMAFRAQDLDDPEEPLAGSPSANRVDVEEEEEDDNDPATLTLLEAIARKRRPRMSLSPGSRAGHADPTRTSSVTGLDVDLADRAGSPIDDAETEAPGSQLSTAIADAMAHVDSRSLAEGRPPHFLGRIGQAVALLMESLGGWEQAFRNGFVLVATGGAANGAAWGLMEWSSLEQSRFPTRQTAVAMPFFPGFGRCSDVEYSLLFGHAVLLAGLIGFLAARWCVSRTE